MALTQMEKDVKQLTSAREKLEKELTALREKASSDELTTAELRTKLQTVEKQLQEVQAAKQAGESALHELRMEKERAVKQIEEEWKLKLDVHYNLGVVLVEQARNAEAAIMYERTLRLDPMHESALLNLAGIYAGTAQWQTADEYIARATAAHPRSKLVASFTAQFRNLQRS